MTDSYTIKYRLPWSLRVKTIKNVKNHWVEDLTSTKQRQDPAYTQKSPLYWGIETINSNIKFIPIGSYFEILEDRAEMLVKKMSREIGQPVQRAL